MLRAWLGEDAYELEWRGGQGGTRSRARHAALVGRRATSSASSSRAPGWRRCASPASPTRHWLREAFGTVAYGFFPMRTMSPELAARLIHSADERIPVDDVELGVDFLRSVAQSVGS